MLYSSDDTHIKNRNATRATPRQRQQNTVSRKGDIGEEKC